MKSIKFILLLGVLLPFITIYSQQNIKIKRCYYIQYVFKMKDSSLLHGRVFLDVFFNEDRILLENFFNGKPCGGAYKFRDTLLGIINRNKAYFPLMSYEIANISVNDSNRYFNTFGKTQINKISRTFYSTYCHQQLSFWCNDYSDLDSTNDIIFSIQKLKLKGSLYKIKDVNRYTNEYSLYKISYNRTFKSNSVFFSKGINEIKKSNLYIPKEFITSDYINTIFVTNIKMKRQRIKQKLLPYKPKNIKC